MDSDSQGDSFRIKSKKNEKVYEQTYGKRFDRPSLRLGSISMSSRLFRAFRIDYDKVQSFLRWYTIGFLPIVWAIVFVIYSIAS